MSWTPAQVELIESLAGEDCPGCLGRKGRRKSFCSRCYFKLPKPIRTALYNPVGNGYEDAHAAAMKHLKPAKADGGGA